MTQSGAGGMSHSTLTSASLKLHGARTYKVSKAMWRVKNRRRYSLHVYNAASHLSPCRVMTLHRHSARTVLGLLQTADRLRKKSRKAHISLFDSRRFFGYNAMMLGLRKLRSDEPGDENDVKLF